jgi:hypothetical protein
LTVDSEQSIFNILYFLFILCQLSTNNCQPPHAHSPLFYPIFGENLDMLDMTTLLTVVIGLMIAGFAGYLFYLQRKNQRDEQQSKRASVSLQLQAYERLTLLTDRIALPNLISRLGNPDISASEMQYLLIKNIKDEFDYNISQQIYVSPEIWNAIRNLKENNLLIINRVGLSVPSMASGATLNRAILEYLMQDQKANLHEVVSEALSYEAKKLF